MNHLYEVHCILARIKRNPWISGRIINNLPQGSLNSLSALNIASANVLRWQHRITRIWRNKNVTFPCHAKFRDIINSEGGLDIPHLMFLSWPLGKQQPLHKIFPIKVQWISIFLASCYLKLFYKKRRIENLHSEYISSQLYVNTNPVQLQEGSK